jgi:aminopeptidase N
MGQCFVAGRMARGLVADGKRNTHAVLDETLQTLAELEGTWDAVCYSKGASLVAMIAAYVGEDGLIRGIRKFLEAPHSVATRHDFWSAISRNEGVDVVSFAQQWITTKGFPVIKVEYTSRGFCLSQERFLQSGDLVPVEDTEIWYVHTDLDVLLGGP